MSNNNLDIFTGTANPELAEEVSKILGIPLSAADVGYFSDGEIKVQIEDNVRGHDTFIIQSTCTPQNKNVMELMLLADALKRSSASKITAIVPYYGYARQDRRVRSARVPISAKVVADMFSSVGIDRVLTIDLHSETIQGFFDMPADNVYATKLMMEDVSRYEDQIRLLKEIAKEDRMLRLYLCCCVILHASALKAPNASRAVSTLARSARRVAGHRRRNAARAARCRCAGGAGSVDARRDREAQAACGGMGREARAGRPRRPRIPDPCQSVSPWHGVHA